MLTSSCTHHVIPLYDRSAIGCVLKPLIQSEDGIHDVWRDDITMTSQHDDGFHDGIHNDGIQN